MKGTNADRGIAKVVEYDGQRWTRCAGTAGTAREFKQAKAVIAEIIGELDWNPWVLQDRADELLRAIAATEGWARATHSGARVAHTDAGWQQRGDQVTVEAVARDRTARRERRKRYDRARERARLSMLELEWVLRVLRESREELTTRPGRSTLDDTRRAQQIEEYDRRIEARVLELAELEAVVGDPDQVCDEEGNLPSERRQLHLGAFRDRRTARVLELRSRLRASPRDAAAPRRPGGRVVASQPSEWERELEAWLSMPPLTADQMCPDCPQPALWHYTSDRAPDIRTVLCPAWPDPACRRTAGGAEFPLAPQPRRAARRASATPGTTASGRAGK